MKDVEELKTELALLQPKVLELGWMLQELETRILRPLRLLHSTLWQRRVKLETQLLELEGKIKVCKPQKAPRTGVTKVTVDCADLLNLLTSLTPTERRTLMVRIIKKGEGHERSSGPL